VCLLVLRFLVELHHLFTSVMFTCSGSCTLRTKELTDLVRTGVPIKYRSEIWMVFSGSLAEVSTTCQTRVSSMRLH